MATLLKSLQTRLWRSHRSSGAKGFTLVELLITTIIAGGLVSGLMYLVIELLTADQRDASRNATQQDMQRSLDYMGAELRQAVYVYPGDCLGRTPPASSGCPGLLNYLPNSLSNPNNVPILAFWRQEPLPPPLIAQCAAQTATAAAAANSTVPCAVGHSYALIVYSLNSASGSIWSQNNARITRYKLTQYNSSGAPNAGYVVPIQSDKKLFASWPNENGVLILGFTPPNNSASPAVLTDFVNTTLLPTNPSSPTCPTGYTLTTPTATPQVSFFYGCVSINSPAVAAGNSANAPNDDNLKNQEVLLFLRGNASGRPGINTPREFQPALTTRVLTRGMLDIDPAKN